MFAAVAFLLSSLLTAIAAASGDTVKVVAGGLASQIPVPSNYVGFSIEVSSCVEMIGKSPQQPRAAYWRLLDGLHHSSTQQQLPTVIRCGGNSADESIWNPHGDADTAGYTIRYNITDADLQSYQAFSDLSNGMVAFIPDLSFIRGDNASWPAGEVAAIAASAGGWKPIHAVSIGNEIDLFARNGLRPKTYNYSDYKVEFNTYANAVRAAGMPSGGFIRGATWCCFGSTFDAAAFADFAATFRDDLKDMSYHRYPLSHCGGGHPSIDDLLQPQASTGQADRMRPFSQGAAASGLPFAIGESNSVSCGGQEGVSDVLGAALWAVDYLFALTTVNTTMVNFHGGPEGAYAAVAFNSTAPGTPPDVRPLYYGLRVFAEASADGASVLELDTETSTNKQVRVWAVTTTTAATRFVVIHKDYKATGPASITVSRQDGAGAAVAQLATLQAASGGVLAKTGLTWAGQTWDGSADGSPVGERSTTSVHKDSDGSYTFSVQPGTAAVLFA